MRESATTGPKRFAVRGKLAIAGSLHDGAVVIEDGTIVSVTRSNRDGDLPSEVLDAGIVAPGYVDLQVNGGFGREVSADPLALGAIESWLPSTGVANYLPTVISSDFAFYDALMQEWDDASPPGVARRCGLHLEGPFLSPERKGAHPLEAIESATDAILELFLNGLIVSLVTLAPERPGNLDRIRKLREVDISVSLGHTNATVDQFIAGIDEGARMVTHLFNAMSPFNHREPGVIGAALTDDRLVAGLIADGVHAHPRAIDLAVRAKGVDRIALVSDMMAAAGMPAGDYTLGGQVVETDGTSVRLPDGTLAGSVLTMDQAVRSTVEWASVSPAHAIRMATEVPGRIIGNGTIGTITPGGFADLTILDDELTVVRTIIEGKTAFVRAMAVGAVNDFRPPDPSL